MNVFGSTTQPKKQKMTCMLKCPEKMTTQGPEKIDMTPYVEKEKEIAKENKPNPWREHVKKYRLDHPGVSFKECLQKAKETYKKVGANEVAEAMTQATA